MCVCATEMVEMFTESYVGSTSWWMDPLQFMNTDSLARSKSQIREEIPFIIRRFPSLQVISLASDSERSVHSFDWSQERPTI